MTFNQAWIEGNEDMFSGEGTEPSPSGTTLPVKVPSFTGTNWYEVKNAFVQGLASIYGQSGVLLTYLVRDERKAWEQTEHISSLEQRRILTKAHSGAEFNKDNTELHHLLSQTTFTSRTMLQDVVHQFGATSNGVAAWKTLILMTTHGMASLTKHGKRLRRSEACSANDAPLMLYSHMLMMPVPALIIGASLT